MVYANPHIFWLLLLIPVLWILHLRNRERQFLSVSTLWFWKHIDANPQTRLQRSTMRWLLMLLDALLLLGLVVAWSELRIRPEGILSEARDVLIVVDHSLSMSPNPAEAKANHLPKPLLGKRGSRSSPSFRGGRSSMTNHASVRSAYTCVLNSLPPDARVDVVAWADSVRSIASGAPHHASVTRALEQIIAVHASNDVDSLLAFADAVQSLRPDTSRVLITDGRFRTEGSHVLSRFLIYPVSSQTDSIIQNLEHAYDTSELLPARVALVGSIPEPLERFLESYSPALRIEHLDDGNNQAADSDLFIIVDRPVEKDQLRAPTLVLTERQETPAATDTLPIILSESDILSAPLRGRVLNVASAIQLQATQECVFLATCNGAPVVTADESGAFRMARIGLPFRDSSFTQTWMFPVLMADIISWLLEIGTRAQFVEDPIETDLSQPAPALASGEFSSLASLAKPAAARKPLMVILCAILTLGAIVIPRQNMSHRIIRVATACVLFIAIGKPLLMIKSENIAISIVQDVSPSMSQSAPVPIPRLEQLDEQTEIRFASETSVATGSAISSQVKGTPDLGSATNLASALTLAGAIVPHHGRRAIALHTDGQSNRGDTGSALALLQSLQVPVYPIIPTDHAGDDPRVVRLDAPSRIAQYQPFQLRILLAGRGLATLQLDRNGDTVLEQEMEIRGVQSIPLEQPGLESGSHLYEVFLRSESDLISENNSSATIVDVIGSSIALILSDGLTDFSETLLPELGWRVIVREPSDVALESQLRHSRLLVLEGDCSEIAEQTQQLIADLTHAGHLGVLFLGARSLLSVHKRPIEAISPVEIPSATAPYPFVLLIDKSGSMQNDDGSYGDALRAAMAFWQQASHRSWIGAIAFDVQTQILGQLAQKDKGKPLFETGMIPDPQGGTLLLPAVHATVDMVTSIEASRGTVLLISDGDFADESLETALQTLTDAHLKVDTVPVGVRPRKDILNNISQRTGGIAYDGLPRDYSTSFSVVDSASDEPELIRRASAVPVPASSWELDDVLAETLPPVDSWLATQCREQATPLLVVVDDEPIIASMRVGLGKSAAVTLTEDQFQWFAEPDAGAVFASLARLTGSYLREHRIELERVVHGDRVRIWLRLDEDISDVPACLVLLPDGTTSGLSFQREQENLWSASMLMEQTGIYRLTVASADGVILAREQWIHSCPSEYTELGVNLHELRRIARATGGRLVQTPEELLKTLEETAPILPQRHDITDALLAAALLLLFVSLLV